MKLLHVDSSITGAHSASRQLSAAIVAALRCAHPKLEVVRRDLDAAPLSHLSSGLVSAWLNGWQAQEEAQRAGAEEGAAMLEEFLAADIVVIGAPMYNFGISSLLKAWIDRIVVAGRTFRYTPQGAVGLATGKRVIVASSRGGLYSEGMPGAPNDFQEPYLRAILGFIGVNDVAFIRAEGLALGPDKRAQAIAAALEEIGEIGSDAAAA